MTDGLSVEAPPGESRAPSADAYGWDWSATTHAAHDGVVDELTDALGAKVVTLGKGLQGWSQSVEAYDGEGFKLGTVYFGGGREDVHVVSTSDAAERVRSRIVALGDARTSRVDTRVDTLLPFDDLRGLCEGLGGRGTKIVYMEGARLAGGGAREATGRTLYVGAPSSAVRIRVYEKWLESPGQYQEGTNRVEVQLRPPSRAKDRVSGWTPEETFCASKLARRLAVALGTEVANPGTLQKSRGTPDLQRKLESMGEQYGKAARTWLALSGGDVGTLIEHLAEEREPIRVPVIGRRT